MAETQVDPKLLEILVCPLTKRPLRYDRRRQELVSDAAHLAFPIRDGIPIMLVEEARQLEDSETGKVPPPSQTPDSDEQREQGPETP